MEPPPQQKTNKKRSRTSMRIQESKAPSSISSPSPPFHDFPLLLAATLTNSTSLIKKCLSRLQSRLSPPPNQTLPIPVAVPVISLLPALLSSRSPGIARRSAEIVGAASLSSLEMNELIGSDGEIVKALVARLGGSDRRVCLAACSALLDLSTTCGGRQRLLHFSALEKLIFEFLQVHSASTPVFLCTGNSKGVASARIALTEDGPAVSLLDAAITLTNTCSVERLQKIPRRLSQKFLDNLKILWVNVHGQMLDGNSCKSGQWRPSNISVNNLAESIFRLSIDADQSFAPLPSALVEKQFFGSDEVSFKTFISHYWEASPFLLTRLSRASSEEDDVFSSFTGYLNSKGLVRNFGRMLKSFVSCVPIASDELDILSFLEEVRNELCSPIIYQQDIRVVRTEQLGKEVHFFGESLDACCKNNSFDVADLRKCEEAYTEGYTIALRGVEFRFANIAAIADCLAILFGQPSVGVNMYLTPPKSQGLARHYDDHCVFVCQLFGTKKWKVFSQPDFQLPRLYDPLDSQHDFEAEISLAGCRNILLKEGDILYIPRGFAHEACTDGGSDDFSGFSLHVTFGIEVEPPFEWEGFVHVALYCWYRGQKHLHCVLPKTLSEILNFISVNLLHSMIELIANSDPTLRKACLAGSRVLPLHWLTLEQKSIFSHVISQINKKSEFSEVFRSAEVAFAKDEDPFRRMGWLQFLNRDKEVLNEHDCNMPFRGVRDLWALYSQHKDKAELAFMQVKSKFCDEVSFEDVIDSYRILLEKYKKTRGQYMNGMLSLHCN
ncbi:hypothetical protein Tsubulata_031165 [Turnera subulata]|uniref:Bifunctional lysine-specific demethylase and histidyl-hydroxylase n=1 Tax=Turnera subulata TaxID=218843 RepID=A0A9Q0FG07_9ROSI|nr:hypothetical protein Tsubulata_031165 [Turnera subulata]